MGSFGAVQLTIRHAVAPGSGREWGGAAGGWGTVTRHLVEDDQR